MILANLFDNFASSESLKDNRIQLLDNPEMEFIYRLQFHVCLIKPKNKQINQQVRERKWLRQIRRTIDISSDSYENGTQNETWSFEIDWNVLHEIAADCGIKKMQNVDVIPLPLLMVRRFVATDYSSTDPNVSLSHRKLNNALGALMMTYQLKCDLGLNPKVKNCDSLECEEFYQLWYNAFSNDQDPAEGYGGNYTRDERNKRIKRQRLVLSGTLLHIADYHGFISQQECEYLRIVAGDKNNQLATTQNKLRQDWRIGNTAFNEACSKYGVCCQNKPKNNQWDWPSAVRRMLETESLVKNAHELAEQYPVLAYLPHEKGGRKTYNFTLIRYEIPDDKRLVIKMHDVCLEGKARKEKIETVKKELKDNNQTLWTKRRQLWTSYVKRTSIKQLSNDLQKLRNRRQQLKDCLAEVKGPYIYRRPRRLLQHALSFYENGLEYGRDWLRESVFRIYKLPKTCRPAGLQDCGFLYDRSIIYDGGIFSSLHKRTPDLQEYTRWITIPRLRLVTPFVLYFILSTLMLIFGFILLFKRENYCKSSGVDWVSIIFSVITGLQVGFTLFNPSVGENPATTRTMRVPRYSAFAMTVASIYIALLLLMREIYPKFGMIPLWETPSLLLTGGFCTHVVILIIFWIASLLTPVFYNQGQCKLINFTMVTPWLFTVVNVWIMTGFRGGVAGLPFMLVFPFWISSLVWLIIYFDLRFFWCDVIDAPFLLRKHRVCMKNMWE